MDFDPNRVRLGQHSDCADRTEADRDPALKNLARRTCRPRNTCFLRVAREGEGERDLANLSRFWHFLSSMNHAAEKIFCPPAAPGKGQNQQRPAVPRPTSGAAPHCSWSVRPERPLQWPKQLFSNSSFTPITHFNLPLSGRQRWRGGSSNSQWVSQMIHPSFFVALPRRRPRPRPPARPSTAPVQQPQQHFFQTPSSGVVIVVSLSPSPSPLSLLRSS